MQSLTLLIAGVISLIVGVGLSFVSPIIGIPILLCSILAILKIKYIKNF